MNNLGKGVVGAGWKTQNGQIRLKLNSFVVLEGTSDLVITLFPSKAKPAESDGMDDMDGTSENNLANRF